MPPGQLEMLVVVCFLAWEEGRSDVDVVSIVQDIQQDLGVQCPHREVLNLVSSLCLAIHPQLQQFLISLPVITIDLKFAS